MLLYFFFQAEDGIRDIGVTGVQTCALPIFGAASNGCSFSSRACGAWSVATQSIAPERSPSTSARRSRSEERRVGKSVDLGGRRIIKKKKTDTYMYNNHLSYISKRSKVTHS